MKMRLYFLPSVELCLALIFGILAGRVYAENISYLFFIFAASVLLFVYSKIPAKFRWLLPLCFFAGFYLINQTEKVFNTKGHISNSIPKSRAELIGTVTAPINYYGDAYRFVLEAEKLEEKDGYAKPVSGKVSVKVYGSGEPPLPDDRVALDSVYVRPVSGLRNFAGFDYKRFMRDKGIGVRVNMPEYYKGKKRLETLSEGAPLSPFRLGEKVRQGVTRFIDKTFPEETAPLAKAMTVAVTGELTTDARRRFIASGLAHLLAVSGLHVGFVSGITYFALNVFFFYLFLFVRPELTESGFHKKPALLAAFAVVVLYVFVAGMRVSVLRAGIMVGVYFLSAIAGREKDLLNALALSAIMILLFNPTALFSASFLLSYTAVAAIIFALAYKKEKEEDPLEKLASKTWLTNASAYVVGIVKISIAVSVATAPIVMWFFREVHFGGILANVLAMPLAAVTIPFTFIGALFDSAIHPAVGSIVALPAVLALGGIDSITKFFSLLEFFKFEGARPPLLIVALWYVTIFAWFFKLRIAKYSALVAVIVSLLLFYMPVARQKTQVRFFDVGQGEATLIMLKSGENILIDGGQKIGRFDVGDILLSMFRELGVRKLNAVIATHGDSDHAGGLASVLKRIRVEKYFDNGLEDDHGFLEKLRAIAVARGIEYKALRAGMEVPLQNGSSIIVIHPSNRFLAENRNSDDNESSLVLMFETEAKTFLFTADIEKTAEEYLLKRGVNLKADVLKVAHHGSNTSSKAVFLEAVSPEAAVISVGKFNRFRFPSKKVLKRLEKKGIKVYSTGKNGEIIFRVKNRKITAEAYLN